MDVKHNLYGIFPTPIYISKLNKFTKKELNYVDKLSLNINKNMGNVSSKNSYVLKFNVKGNLIKVDKLPSKLNTHPLLIDGSIIYLDYKNKISIID